MSPRHNWDRKDESRTTIPPHPEIIGIESMQVVTGKRVAGRAEDTCHRPAAKESCHEYEHACFSHSSFNSERRRVIVGVESFELLRRRRFIV